MRAAMHCGYIPRSEWIDPKWEDKQNAPGGEGFADWAKECDICPGYVVRQPAVIEVCEAHGAAKAGFPSRKPAQCVVEGVVELNRSVDAYSAFLHRKAQKEREAKG
ncbi:MAG TPA: hypothetical protein VD948_06535 [Rhodothermales bacterium]|nr:hypothetical protein [Rhodothermales bacterium]